MTDQRARAWFTAGRLFDQKCEQCDCMIMDMATECTADLDDRCPGFQAIEKSHKEFADNRARIVGEKLPTE